MVSSKAIYKHNDGWAQPSLINIWNKTKFQIHSPRWSGILVCAWTCRIRWQNSDFRNWRKRIMWDVYSWWVSVLLCTKFHSKYKPIVSDSLINTYGVEFPFRRVPRSFSPVENRENSTPETSSASSQNSTLPNDKKTEQRIQVFHRPARTIPVSHKSSIRNRVTYPNQSDKVRRTSDVEQTSDTEAEQFEPKLCVPNKSKKGDMITG